MTIGEKIRMLSKKNKMTLEDVAKRLKIGRSTVLRYEDGTVTNIPSDKVAMMAKLFNVSPAFLIGWTDDPSDSVGAQRTPIVVPDSELFRKVVNYMSPNDYQTVMEIFERTHKRMEEEGVL